MINQTKKKFSESELDQIISNLNNAYGEKGEDWDGGVVKIKGDEKFYAVKAPTGVVWVDFKSKHQEYLTKTITGKKNASTPYQLELNLVVDCLITDVSGCTDLAQFKQDIQNKPALVETLSGMAAELATAGLDGLKKN